MQTTQLDTKKTVQLYTDGACSGNPGPGGWAAILRYGKHEKEIYGFVPGTTNNRMELFAVIAGLGELKTSCNIEVYSDSSYVVNAFNDNWIGKWLSNGWKTAQGSLVENKDLWHLLLIQMKKHTVTFIKVKAHADHPENKRCDELARSQILENNHSSTKSKEES